MITSMVAMTIGLASEICWVADNTTAAVPPTDTCQSAAAVRFATARTSPRSVATLESPAPSFENMSTAIVLRSADTNRLMSVLESVGRSWKLVGSIAANGSAGITVCRIGTGEGYSYDVVQLPKGGGHRR